MSLNAQLESSYAVLMQQTDKLTGAFIQQKIYKAGFDQRSDKTINLLEKLDLHIKSDITYDVFCELLKDEDIAFYQRLFEERLVVPDFAGFCESIQEIYSQLQLDQKGKLPTYIPELKKVDPDQFAIAACTVDGQQFHIGDYKSRFCMQSMIKPVLYALALEENGIHYVHKHVGREPSGRNFNELTLNDEGLPHNPMINAGAIMSCAMIKKRLSPAGRFKHITNALSDLSNSHKITFNNAVYNSEKETADRNYALGYFMREHKAFPKDADLHRTLNLYFQACSIEVNSEILAIIAASFANAGTNPITQKEVFKPETIKNCLSLMYSCGMYDYSGEWAFSIGLPAKSGVSGGIYVVIPDVMGICIYSPRLDKLGNSARGIEVCKRLVERYNVHNYDSILRCPNKISLTG
ncbi:glutaminase A [Facilibium subflavum]|uniref:glutaminase A n=1 Tax=Facilibium subflavum TaxID=2219058 RepID=UPI001AAC5F5E|nr:glutaminase A [Facilibium subflavum]